MARSIGTWAVRPASALGDPLPIERTGMHTEIDETLGPRYSPHHIRATWDGTGSVEEASRALGFSRAKGYDLIRSGQFPCRVLCIGRKTRVVTASLLRVLESGDPEYNNAHIGRLPTP
ncbi:helix-turn-helix domain-containing protein [Streptomyces sp. NPDC002125]